MQDIDFSTIKNSKAFTTGEIASICKVAARTASKWIDSGKLKGYRIPGSKDRRVTSENLVKFMVSHGMSSLLKNDSNLSSYVSNDALESRIAVLERSLADARKVIDAAFSMAGPGMCQVNLSERSLKFDITARENFLIVANRLLPSIDRAMQNQG
jgi:excisionase family DNA binding protein